MTGLPSWLPEDLSHAKLETIGPRLRLRGRDADPIVALQDYLDVLDHSQPEGYVLSRASIEAEHARGDRLQWEIVWLKQFVAQRRREEKQAARLSRFTVNEGDKGNEAR